MKFIRWILGKIILLLNAVFSPRGIKRTNEAQSNVDDKAKQYALYQFEACPFLRQSTTCDETTIR